jgi:hypothetical protein
MPATRHDYIILNKKLDKYATLLEDNFAISIGVDEVERRRLGFYLYILEHVCSESDIIELANCVTDTKFNQVVFNEQIDDCGIDAIHINEDKLELKLFNFKYRSKFNPDKTQSLNDNFISTKFINLVRDENIVVFKRFLPSFREKLEKISDIFNRPQDDWSVELYQVSNEAKEVKQANEELKSLANLYAIQIKALALPTIASFMSIRPDPINATLILNEDAIMSYSESNIASAKSYIARMKCSEILRITCDSNDLRNQVNLEDSSLLTASYLDFGVLFDNVRGLVKKSNYNQNIGKTLKETPKKFFMYNNGITLVADQIKSKILPGGKATKLEIEGLQVVNGGQTLRTIHDFHQDNKDNLENFLYDSEVLVRMFMADNESNEAHKIAEYTNSQNPIKAVDLKSLSSEQIEIERFLDEHDIAYARKSGDTGQQDDKEYKHTINMETFGKILKAKSGSPEKATNSVKDIFEKSYDRLFIVDFKINKAPKLIEDYFSIIKLYKDLKIKGNQLKYFYLIYFSYANVERDVGSLVVELEKQLNLYCEKNSDISAIKALGSTSFKNFFQNTLE